MTWRLVATAIIATLVTGVTGFVWWGLPLQRLRDDVDVLFQSSRVTEALCAEFGGESASVPEDATGPSLPPRAVEQRSIKGGGAR